MSDKEPAPIRREARLPFRSRVKVRCENWDKAVNLYTQNISRGGMFIRTETPLELGTEITVHLALPDDTTMELVATVQHVVSPERARLDKRPAGMGIRFNTLTEAQHRALEEMLEIAKGSAPLPELEHDWQPGGGDAAGAPAVAGATGAPATSRVTAAASAGPIIEEVPAPAEPLDEEGVKLLAALEAELGRLRELRPWEVLGVAPDAMDEESSRAYHGLCKRYHPDAFAHWRSVEVRVAAGDCFIVVKKAYERLQALKRAGARPRTIAPGTAGAAAAAAAAAAATATAAAAVGSGTGAAGTRRSTAAPAPAQKRVATPAPVSAPAGAAAQSRSRMPQASPAPVAGATQARSRMPQATPQPIGRTSSAPVLVGAAKPAADAQGRPRRPSKQFEVPAGLGGTRMPTTRQVGGGQARPRTIAPRVPVIPAAPETPPEDEFVPQPTNLSATDLFSDIGQTTPAPHPVPESSQAAHLPRAGSRTSSAQEGMELFKAGKYREARTLLSDALRRDPRDRKVRIAFHLSVANDLRSQGREDDARKQFESVLVLDPQNTQAIEALRAQSVEKREQKRGFLKKILDRE